MVALLKGYKFELRVRATFVIKSKQSSKPVHILNFFSSYFELKLISQISYIIEMLFVHWIMIDQFWFKLDILSFQHALKVVIKNSV